MTVDDNSHSAFFTPTSRCSVIVVLVQMYAIVGVSDHLMSIFSVDDLSFWCVWYGTEIMGLRPSFSNIRVLV